ncbi:MAG TPA: hypothetical protein VD833_22555 [Vicinamibacterales bacterium]|nr:hypothetical protein [Vicinamibacterales bacterium]
MPQPHGNSGCSRAGRPGRSLAITLLAAAFLLRAVSGAPAQPQTTCPLPEADARWLQRALDAWDVVRRDFLRLEDRRLPWIVLFDAACTWHLAAEERLLRAVVSVGAPVSFGGVPLEVLGQRHHGKILLPNRQEVPPAVKASTALYRSGRAPFLVMALPGVWRQAPEHRRRPRLEDYLVGVMVHEMTHTRHLVDANVRLRELIRHTGLPAGLNDDVIQMEFRRTRGFEAAIERERDLLYQAASETDPARQATTVFRALQLVRERHARYFSESRRGYRDVEAVFLTLEGTAQWAAYRFMASLAATPGSEAALRLVRDNRRYWSQDLGLAVFLVIDSLVPGWQSQVFSPTPPSPFDLLDEAVSASGSRDPAFGLQPRPPASR